MTPRGLPSFLVPSFLVPSFLVIAALLAASPLSVASAGMPSGPELHDGMGATSIDFLPGIDLPTLAPPTLAPPSLSSPAADVLASLPSSGMSAGHAEAALPGDIPSPRGSLLTLPNIGIVLLAATWLMLVRRQRTS